MSVLKIMEWPEKVLETKANEVLEFDDAFLKFVSDMHETMEHAHGIGLAANQVNSLKRVFVVHIPYHESEDPSDKEEKKPWHDKRYTFVNPKIIKKDGKTKCMEGCLSFPDIYEYIQRADRILVRALDEKGKEFEIEADGLFSVCIQHELDHLDGITFVSRMSRLKAGLVRKKLQKKFVVQHQNEGANS